MQLTPPITSTASKKTLRYFIFFLFTLLVFTALCLYKAPGNSYSIFKRTWGFDHIQFYELPTVLAFAVLCLVLIVPYTNALIQHTMTRLLNKTSGFANKKLLLFLLLSLLAVFLFYVFRVKYYFLGDFNIRMIQTMKKEFVATEYLTMRILYHFTTLGVKAGFTQEQVFKFYSCLAGACFVFFSCLTADLVGKTKIQKTLFFLVQIASAIMLVFCGYVEVYATPVMLLAVYHYFGLRFLYTQKGFVPAVLSLAFAIACHVMCLAALPSLALIWYFRNKEKVPFITKLTNKKIAFGLTLIIFLGLIIALRMKSGFLLTLSAPPAQPKIMTLFSFRHIWEILNGMLLSCGLSFLLIFILLAKVIREKKQLRAEHYFLLSTSGGFFLLVFMANLQRGSGDWDIMAFPAVSLNLITALLIVHLYGSSGELSYYLLITLAGINGIQTALWLQINHTDKSIAKIANMLQGDPGNYYVSRISPQVQLALAYKNNKLHYYAERAAMEACNAGGADDLRACVMYGIYLQENKKKEEARAFFEELLRTRGQYIYEAYLFLLDYYQFVPDKTKFDYYLNLFFDTFYQDPMPYVNNVNFSSKVVIGIFEALYQRTSMENTKRREQIRIVIERLTQYKPAGKL